MNSVVYNRLADVCPPNHLVDYSSSDDLFKDVKVALEIIGYKCNSLEADFKRALGYCSGDDFLFELAYMVWEWGE